MLERLVVTVLGLCFGSFFNVLIHRLPNDESIISPGSKCPKCGHALRWYENIPVLSWVALRGRCSKCKTRISARYVAVELLTGVLFLACYERFGLTWQLGAALTMVTFLVPLTFIDAAHWILPFELTLTGLAAGIAFGLRDGVPGVQLAALGAVTGFLAFRAVEWFGWLAFKKEAMGAGDKFLVALICAFLGPRALLGIFLLSSLQGSVWGLLMLALKGRAGPAPEEEGDEAQPRTMTWEFAKPGVPFWKRLVRFPYDVLFQPIPDEPKDEKGNEVEWQPDPTSLPYGPWLALSAMEILLIGPVLASAVPYVGWVFEAA